MRRRDVRLRGVRLYCCTEMRDRSTQTLSRLGSRAQLRARAVHLRHHTVTHTGRHHGCRFTLCSVCPRYDTDAHKVRLYSLSQGLRRCTCACTRSVHSHRLGPTRNCPLTRPRGILHRIRASQQHTKHTTTKYRRARAAADGAAGYAPIPLLAAACQSLRLASRRCHGVILGSTRSATTK